MIGEWSIKHTLWLWTMSAGSRYCAISSKSSKGKELNEIVIFVGPSLG